MTHQEHDTLVIVFGAGGRVGRVLLPLLAAGPWTVVAVARKEKPPDPPPTVHWNQIDVTEFDLWERSLRMFCAMAEIHNQVIIVDLLLDKTSVTTMRWSLTAGTGYIARLRSRLAAVKRSSSLVLASTTAVLAPWPYQTPYGVAKRHQLRRYAEAGIAGQALLLPQLIDGEADPLTTSARLVWTYAEAAARILRTISAAKTTTPTALRLIVPPVDQVVCGEATTPRPLRLRDFTHVLELHVTSWTNQRNSALAHRLASHGRLELTPGWLRHRIDHHLVPARLVRLLGETLHAEVEEQQ